MSNTVQLVKEISYQKLLDTQKLHPSLFLNDLEGKYEGLVNLCAGYQDNTLYDQPYAKFFRGMTYDKVNEKIIHYPICKFFNLNENEENQAGNLDFNKLIGVYFKADGIMHLLAAYNNELFLRTKKVIIEDTSFLPEGLKTLAFKLPNKTIQFEYIPLNAKDWNVIVQTDVEKFIVLRIIDNDTGINLPEEEIKSLCEEHHVDYIPNILDRFKTKEGLLTVQQSEKRSEGYVLAFDNGTEIPHYVKMKTDWYLNMRFGTHDDLSAKRLYHAWKTDTLDDLISFVSLNGGNAIKLMLFRDNITMIYNEYRGLVREFAKKLTRMKLNKRLEQQGELFFKEAMMLVRHKEPNWMFCFESYAYVSKRFDFALLMETRFLSIKHVLEYQLTRK